METVSQTELASQRMRYHFSRLQTTPQFAAVLDCLFGLEPRRTEPSIAELALVDDRLVMARAEGEANFRHYVGSREQLAINLVGFVKHLGLGLNEREYVLSRVAGIARR
jgi:hypothetical protein